MNTQECTYKLLKYMKDKLEAKGFTKNQYSFDLSFSELVTYLNHEPEFFEDGVDLLEFKKLCRLNDKEVEQVLNYAFSNNILVRGHGSISCQINSEKSSSKYFNVQLSDFSEEWLRNYENSKSINKFKKYSKEVVIGVVVTLIVAYLPGIFGF